MLEKTFIPRKPFPEFKWQWASFAPTESINDPVVLLGVLFRMEKLEGRYSFSSDEFSQELRNLTDDLKDSVGVNLADRGGQRNVMRNSQQYWKSLNLIPSNTHGMIMLTDFGRKVARHEISQTEFSAVTIMTHQLPNPNIQSPEMCKRWENAGIVIRPLKLILSIVRETDYITVDELKTIVIPLSGTPQVTIQDYVNFIRWYRMGELNISKWPDCCEKANDKRMAREFLLFLDYYGYMIKEEGNNESAHFRINNNILGEIESILGGYSVNPSIDQAIRLLNASEVISDVERKRMQSVRSRPHQAQFRKDVLSVCKRCVITNVTMPEVLEAAHIKPYKYHGEDSASNGFAMRLDIHMLFDTGHLRISPDGDVDLSGRARLDYGALIPPKIVIPDFINRDFLKWRWENYNGM